MKSLKVAVAAVCLLALAACSTTSATQIDGAITNAQTVLMAAKSTVDADAQAGIFTATQAAQIDGYITAADQALSAAQSAYAAGDATTEQAKVAAVLAAVTQINGAVLTAVATHNAAK